MSKVSDASHPTNPNVEKAAREMRCCALLSTADVHDQRAELLDLMGLLVTPPHERALKACERFRELRFSRPCTPEAAEVWEVGHESLASKKVKERWVVEPWTSVWAVRDTHPMSTYRNANVFDTEPQARAVAEALNKLEAK